jgi:hypothetical protein
MLLNIALSLGQDRHVALIALQQQPGYQQRQLENPVIPAVTRREPRILPPCRERFSGPGHLTTIGSLET